MPRTHTSYAFDVLCTEDLFICKVPGMSYIDFSSAYNSSLHLAEVCGSAYKPQVAKFSAL